MDDEILDPLPGDGYEEGWSEEDDIGPPAPGEGDDYPNPEIGMEC